MDTAVNMQIVGSQIQNIEALRELLEPLLGSVPALNLRLEVQTADGTTVITLSDSQITVQDGTDLFQGDWMLARAALLGFDELPQPEPDPDPDPQEPVEP
jgi:hypothetical protein